MRKHNGVIKKVLWKTLPKKGAVQIAVDKSNDLPTLGHRIFISTISYLIERLSYGEHLAANGIDFGGFWTIRINVILKRLGMWHLLAF